MRSHCTLHIVTCNYNAVILYFVVTTIVWCPPQPTHVRLGYVNLCIKFERFLGVLLIIHVFGRNTWRIITSRPQVEKVKGNLII